ncbi:hypothetical protein UlMin_019783, partial [Ulmus minor]
MCDWFENRGFFYPFLPDLFTLWFKMFALKISTDLRVGLPISSLGLLKLNFLYLKIGLTDYLGYTPGLFIVGLFGILILWMYANFWITGLLFIVGGMMRLMAWCFLSINLSFFSNDALNYILQWCDSVKEKTHFEEQQKQSESVIEDDFSRECEYSSPTSESEKPHSCKSSSKPPIIYAIKNPDEASASKVIKEQTNSADETRRILDSNDHYEALGFPHHIKIEAMTLKNEYQKK